MTTKIEWCDETVNPIVGCTKVSEGCRNCYAEKMAWRLKCMGHMKYQNVVNKNGWTGNIYTNLSILHKLPFKSKKVFIVSMGDIFHESIPIETHQDFFNTIHEYPWHTYILLTKRPQNIKTDKIQSGVWKNVWQPNLWLGVTAENQRRADERIPILLQIPAAVRFVSVEPMLEFVNLQLPAGANMENQIFSERLNFVSDEERDEWFEGTARVTYMARLSMVDWVIAGPETGPGARPCPPGAIESLYEQCKNAGVPFFDKRPNFLAREFPR